MSKDDLRFFPMQNLHKKQQKLNGSMVLSSNICLKKKNDTHSSTTAPPSRRADRVLLGFVLGFHHPLVVGVPQDEAPVDDS